MENRQLIELAKEAMKNAHVPYSNFKVGAAIQMKSGKVYTGCNVENASYGATNCAERTAVFKAVSEGEKEIEKVAIVSSSKDTTYPCGICRQVLAEFMRDGEFIFENAQGEIITINMEKILPYSFREEDIIIAEEENE